MHQKQQDQSIVSVLIINKKKTARDSDVVATSSSFHDKRVGKLLASTLQWSWGLAEGSLI